MELLKLPEELGFPVWQEHVLTWYFLTVTVAHLNDSMSYVHTSFLSRVKAVLRYVPLWEVSTDRHIEVSPSSVCERESCERAV